MNWWYVAIIAGGIVLLFVTRYFRSFFHDYGYDAALSFLDEFFGGLIGLDWGDLIAAVLMYRGEKKRVGMVAALIIAWEATNFAPIGMIPVVGTGLEYVTNLFPAATVMNFFFNRRARAEEYREELDDLVDVADIIDVDVSREQADTAYDNEDWVKATRLYHQRLKTAKQDIRAELTSGKKTVKQELYRLLEAHQGDNSLRGRKIRVANGSIKHLLGEMDHYLDKGDLEQAAVRLQAAENTVEKIKQ